MRVMRNLDVGIINQGSSGFVYDEGSVEKVCDPKIVITAYGINDYGRKTIEQLEEYAVTFFKKLRKTYKDAKIVSILPLWTIWDSDVKDFGIVQRTCLTRVYEKYSDYIIDGHNMMPHNKEYLGDGVVHPNDKGFEYYCNNLTNELKKFL